jgi:alpha-glucan, water dikinase
MTTEKIITESGIQLYIEKHRTEDKTEISLETDRNEGYLLHWGVSRHLQQTWQTAPKALWPEGSKAVDEAAVRTPFRKRNGGYRIVFSIDRAWDFSCIVFALFLPEKNHWDNNRGRNYRIDIRKPSVMPIQALIQGTEQDKICYQYVYHLEKNYQLAVVVTKDDSLEHIALATNVPGPLIMHWGLATHSSSEWALPPPSLRPAGSTVYQNKAVETPFEDHQGHRRIQLQVGKDEAAAGIPFVMKHVGTGSWLKNRGSNFFIPLMTPSAHGLAIDSEPSDLAGEIIEKETGNHSWTLMHRFNLCSDLLDKIRNGVQELALIFVWLRFSAIRQLDWQRNYNTQPRELSHAQDRLTRKLAQRYTVAPDERPFIRLILTTMGRGGKGQRIRDEILNIMHRHHIKEVSGHFLEEWHQKLHNNTTPDDVVICEAYLAFLRHDGDLDTYYRKLEQNGVTRERLESYDRPIRSHPDFIPHLKDGLIHDFEVFLGILKHVHAGTDLGAAIYAARYLLDADMHALMDFIWQHRDEGPAGVCTLVEKITEARQRLTQWLTEPHRGGRDLLFLDLALEDFLRVAVERCLHSNLSGEQMLDLIAMMLENRSLTDEDEELMQCLRQWKILEDMPRFGKKWSLQAKAVLDRIALVIGGFIDSYYQDLQPKAEFLGNAFSAEPWTITRFTEEVVRGRPVFVLVMLLRHLDPILRRNANLGNWQVVSRGRGLGTVEVVADLKSVQGKTYERPTVIITDHIAGDEDIPPNITAIITSDAIDIVSHVAIRARNGQVLIATCYDLKTVDRLKSLSMQTIKLHPNHAGDVVIEEGMEEVGPIPPRVRPARIPTSRSGFTAYVVTEKDFNWKIVGGKSNNLKRLRNKVPEWISIPGSVALPFGVFERVLVEEKNTEIARHYEDMIQKVNLSTDASGSDLLNELRETVCALYPPRELISSLSRVWEGTGFARPGNWNDAWMCIKRVWGSKWNERAFLNRRAQGIPHEDLLVAVLIQPVVEAEYSFVIHTVNPFTGDRDEIYAEVVLGLGETLVGNYPGRALSFALRKGENEPQLLAFPSKSAGLFGRGFIFRSDSNGEDLVDYAGAGLYDSIMSTAPRKIVLDYAADPLISDEHFQRHFLETIATIGTIIEEKMGAPQDIEGAYARDRYYVLQTRPQVGEKSDKTQSSNSNR